MSLKTLTKQFKGKSENDILPLVRGHLADFPEGYLLFKKRDMFGDSQFPHTLVPNNVDDVVAFLVHEHGFQFQPNYELRISEYQGPDVLLVETYYPNGQHWVQGFLMYNPLEGVELPLSLKIAEEDAKRYEGWSTKVIREREADSRTDGNTQVWTKA